MGAQEPAPRPKASQRLGSSLQAHLEHLECSHAQDRGAEKRTQLAGRSVSGYGLESPAPAL